ncbi:DnaJ domain-containing protein [Microbacterium sp. Root61]|uniref:J domain-containing protein n=1 Tax=Microbacterium sp. Root61 TaxID=1736570 RepID=UPI0009EAA7ED
MTLDEARAHLGVTPAATVDEIRDAFRRQARALHPDLHPEANPVDRARLGREFHNAREARDILVRYTGDPLRRPAPDRPHPQPSTPRRPAPAEPTRANRAAPPPRVTMRFDEFVAWTDAAGFGTGVRSPRHVDWTRIIVWSTLGLVIVGLVAGAITYSTLI